MHWDDDYEDSFIQNPNEITHLYQLRHAKNILGIATLAKALATPADRITALTNSYIHGSKEICEALKMPKNIFEEFIEQLTAEQEKIDEEKEERYLAIGELIYSLHTARNNFCQIGTNKTKRRLNKISKNDPVAKALRIALEIEDKNILAKEASFYYAGRIYKDKNKLINQLIELFKENNWIYGVHSSDVPATSHIVYFEIPNCEQISWHSDVSNDVPIYNNKWDGKTNSTLPKLEKTIMELLSKNKLL